MLVGNVPYSSLSVHAVVMNEGMRVVINASTRRKGTVDCSFFPPQMGAVCVANEQATGFDKGEKKRKKKMKAQLSRDPVDREGKK